MSYFFHISSASLFQNSFRIHVYLFLQIILNEQDALISLLNCCIGMLLI